MLRTPKVLAALAIAGGLAATSIAPAFATDSPAPIDLAPKSAVTLDRLEDLNPGATETDILTGVDGAAAEQGVSADRALELSLVEAEKSAAEASTQSSGGGTVYLGRGDRSGDLFVSPASTLFVQHGHTGIYYTTGTIVEAPGTGKKSRSYAASSLKVGKGTVKQYVKTTTSKRNASGSHAYMKLRGKEYNTNFAFNKVVNGAKMNCSQLVWAAYKVGGGLDLDGNGGFGVYPYDIKNSKHTVTYQTR